MLVGFLWFMFEYIPACRQEKEYQYRYKRLQNEYILQIAWMFQQRPDRLILILYSRTQLYSMPLNYYLKIIKICKFPSDYYLFLMV